MKRRTLMSGGSAICTALMAGTVANAENPDAALLDLFRRWQPLDREREAVNAIYRDHPDERDPDGRAAGDARFDAYTDQWHDLADDITALPARTPEGIQAKATVLRAMLLNHTGDFEMEEPASATPSELLAWSLVRDMLAGGAS